MQRKIVAFGQHHPHPVFSCNLTAPRDASMGRGVNAPADRPSAPPRRGRSARRVRAAAARRAARSEEHTSELQSLMRISYAVFCLKKNKYTEPHTTHQTTHLQERQPLL